MLWLQLPDHEVVVSSEWLGKVGTCGIPTAMSSRSLAGIRASHHELVGTVLTSRAALPKRKTLLWLFHALMLQPWFKL